MDGKRSAAAGLFGLYLIFSPQAPLHAAEPPAAATSVPALPPPPASVLRKPQDSDSAEQILQAAREKSAWLDALNQAIKQQEAARKAAQLAAQQEEQRKLLDPAQTRVVLSGSEQQVREALTFQGRAFVKQGRVHDAVAAYGDYISGSRRTPSGVWMSSVFYAGIRAGLFASVPEDAQARRWEWLEEQTLRWAREEPDSPLPRLMHAEVLYAHAWEIRGTRYVKDTPQHVWKPFHAMLSRTLKYLDEERAIAARAPEYYSLSLRAMRGSEDGGDPLARFDQGQRAFPGYYQMYFEMLETLLPKWGGSVEHMDAFAEAAVDATRKTEGESMYARIYWVAAQGPYRFNLFDATSVRWGRMKQGFEDVMKRYPDQWNLQNYARFACDAQDRDKLAELLAKVQMPPMMEAWSNPQLFEKCSQMAGRVSL
jgi:hypothetical protein